MASYPNRCQHLKINGTQCGSPALRRNRFCFFHKRFQDERIRLAVDRKRRPAPTLTLPLLEDANSIQMALQQVMRLVLHHDVDYKTAGLLLYALQTASSNLRQTKFEAFRHDVILDPRHAADTSLGQKIWEDEDFEEDQDDDPESIRIEQEAQRAAQAVRARYQQRKADAERRKNFYAKYPHLKPGNEQLLAAQPAQKDLPPKPACLPAPSQAHPLPKKPPLPTPEEFDRDIHDLTRKHFFPDMPDDIYNKAIAKKENS
ncbi:MAG TPA: hypothetical protein VF123_18305 [Candidatus Sulfotelmatobacter sp.]